MAAKGKQFYVAIGFNIPDPASKDGGELRYDVGEDGHNLVTAKDFDKGVWKSLVDAGAIAEVVEDADEE